MNFDTFRRHFFFCKNSNSFLLKKLNFSQSSLGCHGPVIQKGRHSSRILSNLNAPLCRALARGWNRGVGINMQRRRREDFMHGTPRAVEPGYCFRPNFQDWFEAICARADRREYFVYPLRTETLISPLGSGGISFLALSTGSRTSKQMYGRAPSGLSCCVPPKQKNSVRNFIVSDHRRVFTPI